MPQSFAARYRAAERLAGGRCPIEAGLIRRLADHECRHGRARGRPRRPVAPGARRRPVQAIAESAVTAQTSVPAHARISS